MSAAAIAMMIVAIVLVWGGLVVAIIFLARHPLQDDEEIDALLEDEGPAADSTR